MIFRIDEDFKKLTFQHDALTSRHLKTCKST